MYKNFTSLSFLGFATNNCTFVPTKTQHAWNQWLLQEMTGCGLQKAEKLSILKLFTQLLTMLQPNSHGIATLKPLKLTKSFLSLPSPQRIKNTSFN